MHGLRKIKLDFFYRNYLLSLLSFIYRGKLIVSWTGGFIYKQTIKPSFIAKIIIIEKNN